MRRLSISLAWDETKAALASDGRLLIAVTAALVTLPLAVLGVLSPAGVAADASAQPWLVAVVLVFMVLLMTGQLAMVRLAVGPSISVAEAIAHGARRFVYYFLSTLIVAVLVFAGAAVLAILLLAAGVPVRQAETQASPAVLVAMLLFVAGYCFLWVRILAMSSAVAGVESVGPLEIVRRSWTLTSGHFWKLFGFLLLFLAAAMIAMLAIGTLAGLMAHALLGPVDPLSLSALLVSLVNAITNGAVILLLTVMLARIYVQLSGRGSIEVAGNSA